MKTVCALGLALAFSASPALAKKDACPPPGETKHRTAAEVWEHRIAAFQRSDFEALMCDYHEDVTVILENQVIRGKAAVRALFEQAFGCLTGNQVILRNMTAVDDLYFKILFSVYAPGKCPLNLVINEGTETFILEKGLIIGQAIHLR